MMDHTNPKTDAAAPLTAEQIAAIWLAIPGMSQDEAKRTCIGLIGKIDAQSDENAALRDRLARAETTIGDLRAHIAEQAPLVERRGQIIEEQRIALARAEGRIARYAEKCAEIEYEYHTTAWHPDQCASVAFENRIIEAGQMASDDAPTAPSDGAARAGGCPLGGTAKGETT